MIISLDHLETSKLEPLFELKKRVPCRTPRLEPRPWWEHDENPLVLQILPGEKPAEWSHQCSKVDLLLLGLGLAQGMAQGWPKGWIMWESHCRKATIWGWYLR
jgi:hypothetical protein